MIFNQTDFVLDLVETKDAAVDRVIDLVDRVVDVVDGCGVAESILDAADLVFDLIEAKGGIGEKNGLIFNQADFILDFVKTKDAAVDGVVDLVDCVVDIVDGGGIADSVLDASDFVFDFIEAKSRIGEKNSLVLDESDFIFDLVEAKDAAVDGVVDLVDRVVNVVDDGRIADGVLNAADFVFDFVQAESCIGEKDGLIFNGPDFILDLVEAEDAAVDGVVDLINGVVGLIDCVINVVDGGRVADSILDATDFVFNLI